MIAPDIAKNAPTSNAANTLGKREVTIMLCSTLLASKWKIAFHIVFNSILVTPYNRDNKIVSTINIGAVLKINSDAKEVLDIVDGGFYINQDYTPSRLYELAKMDGAIILSEDLKKILYANAQLIPSSSIATNETGTRHRTAERTAKQTGKLVISISQRRNIITVYKGNYKYIVEETTKILTKANQALQTLEKYKKVFDNKVNMLNEYEFNDWIVKK